MHRPHHHLDRSRLKHGWTASEPVRSLCSNLSYLLFAVTLNVEGGWRPLGRHRLYQFSAPNYSKTSDTAYIQNIAIIHSYHDILVGL